jgi:hypothetical protein
MNQRSKLECTKELESAIFAETGLFPCEKMIKFILNQNRVWVNDLANLVRYTPKNKRIQFESELTKAGYRESAETFTYTIE